MSYSTLRQSNTTGATPLSQQRLEIVRQSVKDLLLKSQAFRALPPETQREIAKNTVEVANYLAAPEGIPGHKLATAQKVSSGRNDPYAFPLADDIPGRSRSRETGGQGKFTAQAAREGAAVAGVLLQQVNFPEFVAGLINGVFHSIVQTSIQQMEAYGKLVADVVKSLNQFRDENVSANQGRDHLAEQFPDTFMIDIDTGAEGGPGPRVRLRDGVDESAALQKVNSQLPMDGGPLKSLDLENEETEQKLVQAARTQLATSRQQLLATMVLMGINRIVVTDGRISAKVMYDFQARDTFKSQLSATQFDYGDQYTYTSEGEYERESQGGERSRSRGKEGEWNAEDRDASYYAKGKYKNSAAPVLKLASAYQENTDAALQTRASLAGQVDINFKSDYLPLEKMADSFQIGNIQDKAKPKSTAPAPGSATTAAPSTPKP